MHAHRWTYTDSPVVLGISSKSLSSFEPNIKLVPHHRSKPSRSFHGAHWIVLFHSSFVHACKWSWWKSGVVADRDQSESYCLNLPERMELSPSQIPLLLLQAPISSWLTKILIRPRATAVRPQKHIHRQNMWVHPHCLEQCVALI